MKIRILENNTAQHTLLKIGKELLVIVGYVDDYYSAFGIIATNNSRITENLVLKDKTASYDSPKRWIRYRYFRLCTLPFGVKYKWKGIDRIFKIHPKVWIRLNKVK